MDLIPLFVKEYLSQAERLISKKAVLDPVFSNGTYQFEIQEEPQRSYFAFLQIKQDKQVSDCFCSCKISELGSGCPHLAAAYLSIFQGHDEPLHVRFERSFWNKIFFWLSEICRQDHLTLIKKDPQHFILVSNDEEILFEMKVKEHLQNVIETLVENRPIETEETSIKFSNLSFDELKAYKNGILSSKLFFELSVWSDLAKFCMHLAERENTYQIIFDKSPIPQKIEVVFDALSMDFNVKFDALPNIIASLSTVQSPLKVYQDPKDFIKSIEYIEDLRIFKIEHNESKIQSKEGVFIFDWLYVANDGFYRCRQDNLIQKKIIEESQIGTCLDQSYETISKFLKIFAQNRPANYTLAFDEEANLKIDLFVLEKNDMASEKAAIFYPWAYVPHFGFFRLEGWAFKGRSNVILKAEMADFINQNKLWLQQFKGFETHLGSLDSYLVFSFRNDDLVFDSKLNMNEKYDQMLHFDEWVYVKDQGFYMKKMNRVRLPIQPGQVVHPNQISSFIDKHKDELEQVVGFFNPESPIVKTGLCIEVNQDGLIVVEPKWQYSEGVEIEKLKWFGDYVYVPSRGFSLVPAGCKLPFKYQQTTVISSYFENTFLQYELEHLKPYVIHIDPKLVVPDYLKLKVYKILPARKAKGRQYLVDLRFESNFGQLDLFSIWDGLQQKKRYLFSSSGLIDLKDSRFQWIKQLSSKKLDRKKGLIKLTVLEWIRLSVFEEVKTIGDPETDQMLLELNQQESTRLLDISKLKSTLRPYQETGLNWLWYLYCHGLSGLLCDDMGLGKTHQAMALLAAILSEDRDRKNKYMVVCPTSVIYHWQQQLKQFLPDLRVCTYYGIERSLDNFENQYDLILTSYGILRSGKQNWKDYSFELAIFDEIQIAKNHASQTHKTLKSIQSQMRLGLSGTPIENRLRELKSLFDIVLPSYMPLDAAFRDLFINPIEKHQDESKKALLAKLVRPFILRRRKTEVLTDLPGKIEEIAYCELSNDQKILYKEVTNQLRQTVYKDLQDESKPISFVHVFSALSSLKRICDHPCLVKHDVKNYHKTQSGKWDLFIELLEEARGGGQKVVVFSQYLEMLQIIEQHLKKNDIGFASIKGSTKDRAEQLKKFKEDPKCEVFVASLLAAGVGIDLTVASIVIHYDRWWNPAKENQATDRVHRIGQNRGVQVFKLVTKNTIEEHIHSLIEKKKGLIEDIVGAEDQIQFLSRDELLKVFELMFNQENPN